MLFLKGGGETKVSIANRLYPTTHINNRIWVGETLKYTGDYIEGVDFVRASDLYKDLVYGDSPILWKVGLFSDNNGQLTDKGIEFVNKLNLPQGYRLCNLQDINDLYYNTDSRYRAGFCFYEERWNNSLNHYKMNLVPQGYYLSGSFKRVGDFTVIWSPLCNNNDNITSIQAFLYQNFSIYNDNYSSYKDTLYFPISICKDV